ncbi:MAG: hypothetical protein ABJA87_06525 [bacterium]
MSSAFAARSTLPTDTRFYVPKAADGSQQQIARLTAAGDKQDPALIHSMVNTPQAVWFTSGTPEQVRQRVEQTAQRAAGK